MVNFDSYYDPLDEEGPCLVCGQAFDNCICPECPTCGDTSEPDCYLMHGLRRTEQQKFYMEISERQWHEDFEAYHAQEKALEEIWEEDKEKGFE